MELWLQHDTTRMTWIFSTFWWQKFILPIFYHHLNL